MTTQRSWSGAAWEQKAGYCRALRVGDHVWVAGTAPFMDDGSVAAPGDLGGQTRRCLQIIAAALEELGAAPGHVVATRMYVTDISRAAELSDAHRQMFAHHPPIATLVEVSALVHPDILVEVEAEAVVREL